MKANVTLAFLIVVFACTPQARLKKLAKSFDELKSQVMIGDDINSRHYFIKGGTWVNNADGLLGKIVFTYGDSTISYYVTPKAVMTSVNPGSNTKPIIRVSTVVNNKTDASAKVLFAAINVESENKIAENQEVILSDVGSTWLNDIDIDFSKPEFRELQEKIPTRKIGGVETKPTGVFLIRGVTIMTLSYKKYNNVDTQNKVGGAIVNVGGNVLSTGSDWILDYKLGVDLDDLTPMFEQNRAVATPKGITSFNGRIFKRRYQNGQMILTDITDTNQLNENDKVKALENSKLHSSKVEKLDE